MLKVKDGINLKILENFGFEVDDDIEWYKYDLNKNSNVYVKPLTKEIILRAYSRDNTSDNDLTIIYDLIDAGLVEKVSK